jgi:hypothetical protein
LLKINLVEGYRVQERFRRVERRVGRKENILIKGTLKDAQKKIIFKNFLFRGVWDILF